MWSLVPLFGGLSRAQVTHMLTHILWPLLCYFYVFLSPSLTDSARNVYNPGWPDCCPTHCRNGSQQFLSYTSCGQKTLGFILGWPCSIVYLNNHYRNLSLFPLHCLIRASPRLLIKWSFLHLSPVHWSSLVFYGPTVDEAVLLGFFLCYSWALGFDLFFDTFNGHTPVLDLFLEQHAKTPGPQTIC